MKSQRGFTLIELMIVVAIIAILAAIAISQYQDYVVRAQVSEGAALADGMKTAVGEYVNTYGRFANGGNASYGISLPASIQGIYVASVGVGTTGVISAHYSATTKRASQVIDTQALVFSPITHAGSIEWVCNKSSSALKDKWVPATCRN
jgi:type IV pilus assembly protein PilA